MAETRVDLRHLLEDIRDSYPCVIEEAILTELLANSLDSGCSEVAITIEPEQRRLTFADNGRGMDSKGFEQYHDIAATTKVRGKGIGFAGVGAKLALLVCKEVLSETRRGRRYHCSRWWLESDYRAPWEEMDSLGLVPGENGTAVRLHFKVKEVGQLLSPEYVAQVVSTHFYPLLDGEFSKVLSSIYPNGVAVTVNGVPVHLPEMKREGGSYFVVRQGKKRKLLGIGFLLKTSGELPEERWGLAVSTYGKVIKRGWEWLGITPKNPNHLAGVVELPGLVDCLTTNKCDFMRDPNSLQKYYKYRRAVQDAVAGVLEQLGEARSVEPKPDRGFEKLRKEIEKVVGEILPDFPELAPLFGRKKTGEEATGTTQDAEGGLTVSVAEGTDVAGGDKGASGTGEGTEGMVEGLLEGTHLDVDEQGKEQAKEQPTQRRRPGLMIGFDEETGGDEMAWLRGSTVYINALHPAYRRVQESGSADLYITFTVASTLSVQVEESRSPFEFMHRFMGVWGGMK